VLLEAIRKGRFNGSIQSVGFVRNVEHDGVSVGQCFLALTKGHTPENSQIAAITVGWIEQFIAQQ
jgi:hypothetical protein